MSSNGSMTLWPSGNPFTTQDLKTIVAVLAFLVVTVIVSRITSQRLRGALVRSGFQTNVAILLARSLWAAVWVVGILFILNTVGTGLTPLAAFIGVVGLAASLSLQQVLQNLVAGIYLLAERPFAIGDFITVVGPAGLNHEGRVEDIQMRTTHLRSRQDELILVPNSAVFTGVVTNRTAVGGFSACVTVTFPRDIDPDEARPRLVSLLQGLEGVLAAPAPALSVDSVGEDNWSGSVQFWGQSEGVTSTAVWSIAHAFPGSTVNEAAKA